MDEALEIRRMLAWFKAQLPEHELDDWGIRAQPIPPAFDVEGQPLYVSSVGFRLQGGVSCERCGKRFSIPDIGNAIARSEDSIPRVVENMKEWVERDAGPCWGDIPEVRERALGAVFDTMTLP